MVCCLSHRIETFEHSLGHVSVVSSHRDALLFLLLAAIWGTSFVAIKAGLAYFPPVLFAALRFDIAGVVMLGYAWYVLEDPLPHGRRQWATVGVGALFMIGAYHALLFIGEQHTTSAAAAVIVSLSPVLTTGIARLILPNERLTIAGLGGIFAGLCGVILIARPDPTNLLAPTSVGVGLIFAATAAFAFGSVVTKRLDAGLSTEVMEAWAMIGGAVCMHLWSGLLLDESITTVVWAAEALLAIGYLALVASAIGFLIYFTLLERLGPIEINLVSYAVPIFAALLGWFLLAETIDWLTGGGFLLIFVGFALIKRRLIRDQFPLLSE